MKAFKTGIENFNIKSPIQPQQSLMRPQYFVFEWLLMSALLYYNKFYDIYSLAAAPFGLATSSSLSPRPDAFSVAMADGPAPHVMTRYAADKFRIKHYDSSLLIYFSAHNVMMAFCSVYIVVSTYLYEFGPNNGLYCEFSLIVICSTGYQTVH